MVNISSNKFFTCLWKTCLKFHLIHLVCFEVWRNWIALLIKIICMCFTLDKLGFDQLRKRFHNQRKVLGFSSLRCFFAFLIQTALLHRSPSRHNSKLLMFSIFILHECQIQWVLLVERQFEVSSQIKSSQKSVELALKCHRSQFFLSFLFTKKNCFLFTKKFLSFKIWLSFSISCILRVLHLVCSTIRFILRFLVFSPILVLKGVVLPWKLCFAALLFTNKDLLASRFLEHWHVVLELQF